MPEVFPHPLGRIRLACKLGRRLLRIEAQRVVVPADAIVQVAAQGEQELPRRLQLRKGLRSAQTTGARIFDLAEPAE